MSEDRWLRRAPGAVLVLIVAVAAGPWGGDRLPAPGPAVPGVPGDPVKGARLYRRLDCVRCHTEPRTGHDADIPPSLEGAGSRARPGWMAAWLRDPQPLRYAAEGIRPRIRMPPAPVTQEEAVDLAAFLATLRDTIIPADSMEASEPAGDSLAAAGKDLFAQYQCSGCHQLGGFGGQVGPALDGIGTRRRPEYVAALLRDPKRVIPGTAMKNFGLWDEEVRALTAFLMTLR